MDLCDEDKKKWRENVKQKILFVEIFVGDDDGNGDIGAKSGVDDGDDNEHSNGGDEWSWWWWRSWW